MMIWIWRAESTTEPVRAGRPASARMAWGMAERTAEAHVESPSG